MAVGDAVGPGVGDGVGSAVGVGVGLLVKVMFSISGRPSGWYHGRCASSAMVCARFLMPNMAATIIAPSPNRIRRKMHGNRLQNLQRPSLFSPLDFFFCPISLLSSKQSSSSDRAVELVSLSDDADLRRSLVESESPSSRNIRIPLTDTRTAPAPPKAASCRCCSAACGMRLIST